jgi:hypothetical protein
MKRKWMAAWLCVGGALIAFERDAAAVSLSFDLPASTVGLGDTVDVAVTIQGLGDFAAPSLGALDLDIAFDSAILGVVVLASGGFLGTPGVQTSIFADEPLPGVLDTREVSLLSPAALDALQPSAFAVGVISFQGLALGTSSLSFSQADLSDAFALPIGSVSVGAGSVTVVPEPGTVGLVLLGLVALASSRRNGRLPDSSSMTEPRPG